MLLALVAADEEADLGGGALSEDLAELAELEERDGRVVPEVVLGLGRESDQPRVVVREVAEVGGGRVHGDRTGDRTPVGLDWDGSRGTGVDTPQSTQLRCSDDDHLLGDRSTQDPHVRG